MSITNVESGADRFSGRVSGLSVVIPVYRSEAILSELVSRLNRVLAKITADYEIILVNDCSPDRSWDVIQQLATTKPTIKPINLMRNYGQHNALLCGIRASSYDLVVTMDDDLQHPPEEIPKLISELSKGADVVYGVPERQQHGLGRDFASWLTKLALQNVMGAEVARNISAFRAFRRDVSNAFAHYSGAFVSIDVLLTWGTKRFSMVKVRQDPRMSGSSGYTIRRLITHAINMVTGFSSMPLQLASIVGFVFTLFGVAVLTYVVGRFLVWGGSVPGFPFLASIIALFSGAQLFALGIMGEYLARMHFRMMERPSYVVREAPEVRELESAAISSDLVLKDSLAIRAG
jgi:glycosyltransferase involved in cell wall biosynthesis